MKHPNWVLLIFALGAILAGLLVQSALVSAMAQFAWADDRVLGLVPTSSLVGVGAAVVTGVVLIRVQRAIHFTDEVVGELKEVTWPTREEAVRASTTVVLTAIFAACLIAAYDFLWKNLADLFLFTES